jgi:hypothetical protein
LANGYVGIGTTIPRTLLDINGSVDINGKPVIRSIHNASVPSIDPSYDDYGNLTIKDTTSGRNLHLGCTTGYSYIQSIYPWISVESLCLQPYAGYVGIGITNPSVTLQVAESIGPTFGLLRKTYSDWTFKVKYPSGYVLTANDSLDSMVIVGYGSTTLRSISCRGTVNASGSDYAEYMYKDDDFILNKGDVVGITKNGLLTNVFSKAIMFAIKSTNPCIVGGDNWCDEEKIIERIKTKYNKEAPIDKGSIEFETVKEELRKMVDRIAFCGQVLVNISNTQPGDWIIPVESNNGGISLISINDSLLTFNDYKSSIGKVISIYSEDKALIIAKII